MAKDKKNVWEMNFATKPAIADRVKSTILPKIKGIRTNRLTMEENWMRFYNMWNVTKDGYHSYGGRANLYVPEVRKNVEAQARQMTEAAFPNDEFFDVSPGLTGTKRGAQAWKSMHRWAIDNCHLRSKYLVAMRQEAMLGTSPIYIPWNKIVRHEFRSARNMKTRKVAPKKSLVEIYNGPDFVVRDLFKWYSMNPNKQDILEEGCFEDMVVSKYDILKKDKQDLIADISAILSGSSDAYLLEEMRRDVERAEAMGLQIQSGVGYAGEATLKKDDEESSDGTHLCTVIYTNAVLPEACEDDEDPELPIPLKIEIYDNQHVALIQRNPFFHQQPPYVIGKYILPNADQFYGQGIPHAIQYMQYEINSKSEQSMDSTTLALNPIAIVDPGLAGANNEFNIEPGATWWANPQGVKFAAMPDVSEAGYRAIAQIKAQMQDYSDRSPALPAQLLGKSRTATQSEIVNDALSIDNKTFQLQNEQMILQPMLEQWEALTDQNMDDDQLVMILGRRSSDLRRTMINRAMLLGKYRYFWKASSAMQNRAVLARQMLDALKTFVMLPPQALQGLNVQYAEFIKILWTEAWQLPDGDKILGQPEEMITQDAEAENKMAAMGLELEVLNGDDDDGHMSLHGQALEKAKNDTEKAILMSHIVEHNKQKQRKQQAQMAQAQGGQPNQGQRRSPGSGNRTQLSPNASAGNMGSGTRA